MQRLRILEEEGRSSRGSQQEVKLFTIDAEGQLA